MLGMLVLRTRQLTKRSWTRSRQVPKRMKTDLGTLGQMIPARRSKRMGTVPQRPRMSTRQSWKMGMELRTRKTNTRPTSWTMRTRQRSWMMRTRLTSWKTDQMDQRLRKRNRTSPGKCQYVSYAKGRK